MDETMEIIACPLCGGKNTHSTTSAAAQIPYFARGYRCEDCQFKGIPLIFNSEKIYKRFLNLIKRL